ncbi:serine/threonine-protein kinase mos isoform X2 [Teleopsis dalmanni]|nr:serine/threonine-protein kinase mos isoform X2 [Teleopsis dalmanni]
MNLQTMNNEANILGWNHPNIVQILKIESTCNFGIVIMERFAGQCLQMVLDTIELELVHKIWITLDILAALSYCHSRHILHLDVKPQNVLVDYSRSLEATSEPIHKGYICKLCDFGASINYDQLNLKSKSKGTVRYMSPEALCNATLTPSSDIYSLGITMWQLHHRHLPYDWIEHNEVVAYLVVKTNLRPDNRKSLSLVKSNTNIKKHLNCYCNTYSVDVSKNSVLNIKNFSTNSENVYSSKENYYKNTEILKSHRKYRTPFHNLWRKGTNLFSKYCLYEKQNTREEKANDFNLDIIFGKGFFAKNPKKEILFENIYSCCWNSEPHCRPTAVDLEKSLKELLN